MSPDPLAGALGAQVHLISPPIPFHLPTPLHCQIDIQNRQTDRMLDRWIDIRNALLTPVRCISLGVSVRR